jgi:hypothetical protein
MHMFKVESTRIKFVDQRLKICSCGSVVKFLVPGTDMSALRALARKVYSRCQVLVKRHTVKLFVPSSSYMLRPTTHTVIYSSALSHAAIKPSPLASCSCIPTPMFYFPGTWSGPIRLLDSYYIFRDSWTRWSDWSRWSHRSSPLRVILYFPGLMRARRLRLNRHHRQWILPLSSNYIFQAGGAPSRPWKLFNVVPRKDDHCDDGSENNKRLYPTHGFMLPRAAAADARF